VVVAAAELQCYLLIDAGGDGGGLAKSNGYQRVAEFAVGIKAASTGVTFVGLNHSRWPECRRSLDRRD